MNPFTVIGGYWRCRGGREENRLYVVMGDGARDEVGGAIDRPYQVEQLMRSLERSRAKSLAFEPNSANPCYRLERSERTVSSIFEPC
jgi:hypothetical protein